MTNVEEYSSMMAVPPLPRTTRTDVLFTALANLEAAAAAEAPEMQAPSTVALSKREIIPISPDGVLAMTWISDFNLRLVLKCVSQDAKIDFIRMKRLQAAHTLRHDMSGCSRYGARLL